MPPICALVNDATLMFAPTGGLEDVDAGLFAPGENFIDALTTLELGTSVERDFLATYPPEILERLRDEIHSCLTTSPRTPIAFAWLQTGAFEMASVNLTRARSITIGGPEHGPGASS